MMPSSSHPKSRLCHLMVDEQGGAQGAGGGVCGGGGVYGEHGGTADPYQPKGYSPPQDAISRRETGGSWLGADHSSSIGQ